MNESEHVYDYYSIAGVIRQGLKGGFARVRQSPPPGRFANRPYGVCGRTGPSAGAVGPALTPALSKGEKLPNPPGPRAGDKPPRYISSFRCRPGVCSFGASCRWRASFEFGWRVHPAADSFTPNPDPRGGKPLASRSLRPRYISPKPMIATYAGFLATRMEIEPIAKERDRTSTKPPSSTRRASESAVWNARAESTRYR